MPYINVMRICKMLIYCVKLDHALYSINYGTHIQNDYCAPHACMHQGLIIHNACIYKCIHVCP